MVKVLKCGEVFSGCDTVIYGKDEDEVVAKEEEHARKDHNMTMIPMDTFGATAPRKGQDDSWPFHFRLRLRLLLWRYHAVARRAEAGFGIMDP